MSNLTGCDYTCQRKQNIEKLRELYTRELNRYNIEYNKYLQYKFSGNAGQKSVAEKEIKPKVTAINETLNNILYELKKNIEYTDQLIANQKRVIEAKNAQVNEKNQILNSQDAYVMNKNNELTSKLKQVDFSKQRNNYRKFMLLLLILLNIILGAILYKVILKK